MDGANSAYLVKVVDVFNNSSDGKPFRAETWVNIQYIVRMSAVNPDHTLYKMGGRWFISLANNCGTLCVNDDDCEKIITNINGSY